MELDGVLGVLALLLHWRVALCLVSSTIVAILVVHLFPWLTGLQGIVLAFLGLAVGLVWEGSSAGHAAAAAAPDSQTTQSVAGTSAGIVGGAWGVFSCTSLQSFVAGIIIFVVASVLWSWYAGTHRAWVSKGRAYFCTVVAAVAYPLGALVGHHAL